MPRHTDSNVKAVKLSDGKDWAVYAIEVGGERLDDLRLFVDRVYRNSQLTGRKGKVTDASVVDIVKLKALRAENASTGEVERGS